MTAEEFVKRRKELNDIISSSKDELTKMKLQYIDDHCPYKRRDKVHVIVLEHTDKRVVGWGKMEDVVVPQTEFDAFVWNIDITDTGGFRPTLHKVKKDGTESIQYAYLPYNVEPIITKIE